MLTAEKPMGTQSRQRFGRTFSGVASTRGSFRDGRGVRRRGRQRKRSLIDQRDFLEGSLDLLSGSGGDCDEEVSTSPSRKSMKREDGFTADGRISKRFVQRECLCFQRRCQACFKKSPAPPIRSRLSLFIVKFRSSGQPDQPRGQRVPRVNSTQPSSTSRRGTAHPDRQEVIINGTARRADKTPGFSS